MATASLLCKGFYICCVPGRCRSSYSDHSLEKEREAKTDGAIRGLSFSAFFCCFHLVCSLGGKKNRWMKNKHNVVLHSYAKVSFFAHVFMSHPGDNVFNVHNIVYTWALISEQ